MLRFDLSRQGALKHLVAAFILCLSQICSQTSLASQQSTQGVAAPEDVARKFYGWYLGARCPEPKRSNMATFRKYVTAAFMKRATARDVDSVLFIAAQDTDETWANNFTVSKATMSGQLAKLEVDLNGKELKRNLNVTLRREGGVWKIDDVKGID